MRRTLMTSFNSCNSNKRYKPIGSIRNERSQCVPKLHKRMSNNWTNAADNICPLPTAPAEDMWTMFTTKRIKVGIPF